MALSDFRRDAAEDDGESYDYLRGYEAAKLLSLQSWLSWARARAAILEIQWQAACTEVQTAEAALEAHERRLQGAKLQ
ncbi:MAG TPA: hypothetical protein VGF29_10725 [Hyphomicrobiaceae bacterium]